MNHWLIFINSVKSKGVREKENLNKIIDIVETTLNFSKKQKGKGLKLFTPKKMLQRLPIALARVKACNTSENLLNEIRQLI